VYQLPSNLRSYYNNYIDNDIREFKLECIVNGKALEESEISSINIEYDLLSGAEEYTIGNLAAAKLTMVVSKNAPVSVSRTIQLIVKLKAQDYEGNIIWIPVPMGKFYIFNVSSSKLSKTVTAYDDLYKTDLENEYVSLLEYPQKVQDVLTELCSILNIELNSANIPDETINRPPIVNEIIKREDGKLEVVESDSDRVCFGMTVGQALGYIASYLGGNFIVDGDTKLKLIKYPTKATKSYSYSMFCDKTVGDASYHTTGLDCSIYEGNIISVGSSDPGGNISFDNPFMDRTRLLNMLAGFKIISYQQAKLKLKGDPTLQLGDAIYTYELDELGLEYNTLLTPILRMTFSYTGGCSNIIESPCKSHAEKTINYKGTLSSRMDRLENTVTSTNSEIDRINNTLSTLKTVKDNMQDMASLINSMPYEVDTYKYMQYASLLQKTLDSDTSFDLKYETVYNHKFL
jgi:hypothetical protein